MILPFASLAMMRGRSTQRLGKNTLARLPLARFARREAHLPLFKSFKGAILAQHLWANAG
jgi:hypothetical protein